MQADTRWTPLYVVLVAGHEKIGRTIFRHISNPHNCLVDSEEKLTPLHVASRFGLPNSARHFLEGGADIDATDKSGWTSLRHALELGNNSTKYRVTNDLAVPSPDKVFETVTVLLEFGANSDLETTESIWSTPITAREFGARH
jgi:ankyrin repeat protein